PERLSIQIVRANLPAARRDNLSPFFIFPNERCGPIGRLVSFDPPNLFARFLVQGSEKGLLLVIIDKDQAILVKDRRSRRPPADCGLERAPFFVPKLVAFHVEAEDSEVPEICIDPFSIGNRSFTGIGVLDMNGPLRLAFVNLLFPKNFSRIEVDAIDLPMMGVRGRLKAIASQVESLLGRLARSIASRRGQKDLVAPDDRTRPAGPGHLGLPNDILGCAPRVGQSLLWGDSRSRSSPKLRPIWFVSGEW